MIQSAGKVMDAPQTFETIKKGGEDSISQEIQRENAFQRQYSSGIQSNQGSLGSLNNNQYNSQIISNPQVKRISNCNSQDTPQQKVIKKQFSKSKERNSSLTNNNTSSNVQNSNTCNTNNNSNYNINTSLNSAKNYQNNLSNQYYQNNISSLINQPVSTLACSTINDTSSIYTSAQNPLGYLNNQQQYYYTNNNNNNNSNNNSAKKQTNVNQSEKNNLLTQNQLKTKDSNILKDATIMVSNKNSQQKSIANPKLNSNNTNKNQYSSVPQRTITKDIYSLDYTLQPNPNRQSLLFRNQENADPFVQSHQGTMRSDMKLHTESQQFYNAENKLPTQSDNLSTTKELDCEGQQHLRNVDNYHISTKCLNDLNSNSLNNKSKPFSLFTKKQEEHDISQNCDQSIVPQETSNSNGVSQTFQNNQKQKQSLPTTSSHQLIFNNENNYQTQFKDLLDWKIDGSKLEFNTSHDQLIQNNSTDLSNKHTQNHLVSDKKSQKSCDCLKEITELKVMISEMQKNQIVQAQINQKLQQDNENLWKAIRQIKGQASNKNYETGNSECDQTKENAYADKENTKSVDKTKYKRIVKSLVSKNKELKKQNNEMESVLKDILLQNEISKQRIGIRDKLSSKNSRTNSRSGVSSNNETEFILENNQNCNYDGNSSQNYHVYRPRSSSNASGINSTKRGNESKSLKQNPYHNILKKAKNLHENIEVLKQDSLILNQVGIHLNTYQSNDTKNITYTPQNEKFGSINNYEQDNSNDIKIRQILSKIQQHETLQNS